MAGKHQGFISGSGASSVNVKNVPAFPGGRLDLCYSEGRQAQFTGGTFADNPHTTNTPEWLVWGLGFTSNPANGQYQTCWAL